MRHFFTTERLIDGPWQAFERDIARLLMHADFDDVRVVGGTGDGGADVVGVKDDEVWVIQCKHTSDSLAPRKAVEEVVKAGKHYRAHRKVLATSRPIGGGVRSEIERCRKMGDHIEVLDPRKIAIFAQRASEYAKSRRELRVYQQNAADKFREGLIDTGKAQVVLATGLGKTVVMAEVVADMYRDGLIPDNRVLVLADKRELVRQLQFGFWHQLPKWIPTHLLCGDESPSFYEGITFATVQSIRGHLSELPNFGLVLIDEAHHIGSVSYREALDFLDPPMTGGVTATPWRGDGFDIASILGKPLVQLGISDGLREKYLCDVEYLMLADDIEWEEIRNRSRHKYSINQLNKLLIIPTRDDVAARHICEVFRSHNRHSGIVFSPTIRHAERFANALKIYDLKARAISSRMTPRDRDKLMTMFRRGEIDILTSVDMFNEGIDVPDVDIVIFMRTTHSRRIFVQQIGRGLRLSPGKEKVIVMDFVSDLRRMAEVMTIEKAASGPVETLPLGEKLINFRNESAGSYMLEWMKDQADLISREDDPRLELPRFDFPDTPQPGGVQ